MGYICGYICAESRFSHRITFDIKQPTANLYIKLYMFDISAVLIRVNRGVNIQKVVLRDSLRDQNLQSSLGKLY